MKKVLSKDFWVDQDIEQLIGELLRYGVITASIVVFLGVHFTCINMVVQVCLHTVYLLARGPAIPLLKALLMVQWV
ncbi:hypothetical protein [Mucilaginibacter sp. SP1R1]|uniref:hypothetical protein n=1 Tax=Mucilaginibacter sp. SP1R1 TaxID=2723091 RepID=UPI003AFFCA59